MDFWKKYLIFTKQLWELFTNQVDNRALPLALPLLQGGVHNYVDKMRGVGGLPYVNEMSTEGVGVHSMSTLTEMRGDELDLFK